MLKVKLNRNLRKVILQGHPWVYREALATAKATDQVELCKVLDQKGDFVAWAIYQPQGPLALRILSLAKDPPNFKIYSDRFDRALALRKRIINSETNCYRLFNGEGDYLPGLVCDIYNNIAVMQFDGDHPKSFWNQEEISNWILENTECKTVYEKPRGGDSTPARIWGKPLAGESVLVKENGAIFEVNFVAGQKTGFFLDQRENRNYLRQATQNLSGINLFSYTGGFSVYAGLGGAKEVTSADISKDALAQADRNWSLNSISGSSHQILCTDIYDYLKTETKTWDFVIVDPPSMAHSEAQKPAAMQKYIELFADASKKVNPNGQLFLSSCTSHISFNDFFEIIDQALSKSRRRSQILRVSGQGPDHPFPHICHEFRYLKFVHLQLD